MTIKVQLVIQGGGAKIFAIMAFLDALQKFKPPDAKQKIEVTSVIGTSAGAVAGTLFAAGVDFDTLRACFNEKGSGHFLINQFAKRRGRWWKIVRIFRLLVLRQPLWSQAEIKNFLTNQLPAGISKFSHIKTRSNIDVYVLATDLTHLQPVIFKDDYDIVEALLHSTAIPFFFRCWHSSVNKDSPLYVDGGIAENLPVNAIPLPADVNRIGITFEDSGMGTPTSALRFAVSLLNAGMSVATQHSVRGLTSKNVHTLETEVSTFEFSRLIGDNSAFKNDYNFLKYKAEHWLQAFAKEQSETLSPWDKNPWSEENDTSVNLMQGLYSHYAAHEAHVKFKYHSVTYRVVVNSLLGPEHGNDEFQCEMQFSSDQQPIGILIIQFMDSLTWGMIKRDSAIEVLDCNQNRLDVEVFPVMDQVGTKNRILLVFLTKPILQTDGICTLRYQDKARTFFPGIIDRLAVDQPGKDDMVLNPSRASATIDQVKFYWDIPKKFANRTTIAAKPENSHPGVAMTKQQCNALGPLKPGFERIGWLGENISKRWGIDVSID